MTNEVVDYPGRGQVEFSPRTPHILEFNNGTGTRAYVTVDHRGVVEITEELAIQMMEAQGFKLEGFDY
jgi:hypothetical protein